MKYVVTIPEIVLLVVTLALFTSIYPIIQWKLVFASPDTAQDYVDIQSDVDSVADKGTHSNFENQKATDSTYDTLTEANTNTSKANESTNFVDGQSDVDSHADHGTHSSFPAMQAGPDSTFDTLTEAETAGGVSISWTEAFTTFTPVGTSWQDYDVYTNKGVPKGAIAEIIIQSVNDAANREVGVRTDGSSLARYVNLHEAEGGGATTVNMLVKVHATTGLIETYCSSTTGITFDLTGYWTGVDFTEMASTFSPTQAATWHDKNLFSDLSVPKGSVCQIHVHHNTVDAAKTAGVRTDGSSLVRSMSIHEAEGTVTATNGYDTYVKTSTANGIIDMYGTDTTTVFFLLLGHFDSTMDYTELWTRKAIGASVWTNVDLTADLDQDGRVTNFVLTHSATGGEYYLGARVDGSGLVRYILEHEAETNPYTGFGITVQSNPSTGIVELWTGTASEYFWLAGYFKWTLPNYELDLEFQWTTADFDEANEYLCIYTGTVNAEALKVDVRNGGSWTNIIASLNVSTWNNVSIGTYLTEATITFRFIGGTETGDTVQSTWQIDCAIIHVWSTGVNYELELEEQFTDCDYTRTFEELCIYMGDMNGETLSVQWWNSTSNSWLTIIASLSSNQWNNVSVVDYLTSATFTIRFVDGTKENDLSQGTWQKDSCLLHTWILGYNLNLRVMDLDLTDPIQGAYVYKDSDVKISDVNGWANWTLVSEVVTVQVKYFGFLVNETSINVNSDKTIDVRCNLFDVTVNVKENVRNAKLSNVNVTVYNGTSVGGNKIKSGISNNNGQVTLTNLPNNTLTFTEYGGSIYTLVIGNATQLIGSDDYAFTIVCNQNYVGTTSNYSILVWVGGIMIPLEGSFVTKRLKRKMYKKRKKPK